MSEEVGLEREDERHAQRAEDLAREQDAEETAAEQVGVGTAPGQPPASGTSARSQRLSDPATGRRDDAAATWGVSEAIPGSVPEGAPPVNVGGAQGDQPEDAVADFPGQEPEEDAGVAEPRTRRSAGRSDLPPGRAR